MSAKFVTLGVSELPNKLFDGPLDLFSLSINGSFESKSVGVDRGNDSFLSDEEISCLLVDILYHAVVGIVNVGEKSNLKCFSGSCD